MIRSASRTIPGAILSAATATVAAALCIASPVAAQQSGGPQPTFDFGGTGIDNSYVLTNANAGSVLFTLGLTATGRCSTNYTPQICGSAVTNDGANTFFAASGAPFISQDSPTYGSWNFDFQAVGLPATESLYLFYGDEGGPVGSVNLSDLPDPFYYVGGPPALSDYSDSWNLGFDYLSGPGDTFIPFPPFGLHLANPPAGFSFDPTATQNYAFELAAFNTATGALDASVYECVDVGSTTAAACASPDITSLTPEPATMSLLAFGLVGLAGFKRRKRHR